MFIAKKSGPDQRDELSMLNGHNGSISLQDILKQLVTADSSIRGVDCMFSLVYSC